MASSSRSAVRPRAAWEVDEEWNVEYEDALQWNDDLPGIPKAPPSARRAEELLCECLQSWMHSGATFDAKKACTIAYCCNHAGLGDLHPKGPSACCHCTLSRTRAISRGTPVLHLALISSTSIVTQYSSHVGTNTHCCKLSGTFRVSTRTRFSRKKLRMTRRCWLNTGTW